VTGQRVFNLDDASELIAICSAVNTNRTGVKTPAKFTPMPFPTPPPPDQLGWTLAFDPGHAVGGDNFWQLWRRNSDPSTYTLCFRGTVVELDNIWEDLHVEPQKAEITVAGKSVPLAENPLAVVHTGFAGGLSAMLNDVLLDTLNSAAESGAPSGSAPMRRLFVTGHSQGAAIATLCHAFLNYQQLRPALRQVAITSYFIAPPKPGNAHFSTDFSIATSGNGAADGTAFRIVNDQDWIPQTPLALELPSDISAPNLFTIPLSPGLRFIHWFLELFLTVKLRLAYETAGQSVILRSTPGSNPQEPNDLLWQHHVQRYYHMVTQTRDGA
jgi:hypothetical protein